MTPREHSTCLLCILAMKRGCTLTQVLGRSREQNIANVRQRMMHRLWCDGWAKSDIARLFRRDHTTVGYAIRKLSTPMAYSKHSLSVNNVPYNSECKRSENQALDAFAGEVPLNTRPQVLPDGNRDSYPYLNSSACQGVRH